MTCKRYIFAAAFILASLSSCSRAELPEPRAVEISPVLESVPYLTAILPGAPETKMAFEFPNWVLKASWTPGDQLSVVPDGIAHFAAGLYTLPDGGGLSADFVLSQGVGMSASEYVVFYPGDKVKSYSDLTRLDLKNQVQSKADPMAHLSGCMAMFKAVNNYSVVDFSDAQKSACMRVDVSGMTFKNPYKLSVTLGGSSNFFLNCYPPFDSFSYYYGNEPENLMTGSTISVNLDGYGEETSLVAWIAMSNRDVELRAGDKVQVKVFCEDGYYCTDYILSSDMVLEGGHCHSLTVTSGWKQGTADYTEYPFDGEVVTLQEAGKGLDLVLMGDGFIAADFDGGDSSEYMTLMKDMADNFFTAQPYIYLKPFFNIYVVKAVSPERTNAQTTGMNGAQNTGTETVFSMQYTPNSTSVHGDDNTVMKYAMKALAGASDMRVRNVTVVVVGNQACRSGTCWNSWYSDSYDHDFGFGPAIAYMGRGTSVEEGRQLVRHEASGHGFGKLADEYSGNQFTNTGPWNEVDEMHPIGFYRNVDKFISPAIQAQLVGDLTTASNVLWHDLFGTENNYESAGVESLGVFEGAFTYNIGFCRPTEEGHKSIMNENTGIFNAPSRRQIFYRANCLMGTEAGYWGSAQELAAFLAWDKANVLPTLPGAMSLSAPARVVKHNGVEQYPKPLGAPVYLRRYWDGNKFIYE